MIHFFTSCVGCDVIYSEALTAPLGICSGPTLTPSVQQLPKNYCLNTNPFNPSSAVIPKPYMYVDVYVFMRLLHGGVLVDDVGSNVCLIVGTLEVCVSWH